PNMLLKTIRPAPSRAARTKCTSATAASARSAACRAPGPQASTIHRSPAAAAPDITRCSAPTDRRHAVGNALPRASKCAGRAFSGHSAGPVRRLFSKYFNLIWVFDAPPQPLPRIFAADGNKASPWPIVLVMSGVKALTQHLDGRQTMTQFDRDDG